MLPILRSSRSQSHSPQPSLSNMQDLLEDMSSSSTSSRSSGSSYTSACDTNEKKLRLCSLSLLSKFSFKSQIYVFVTVMLVAGSFLHTGTKVLSSTATSQLRKLDHTCPIQQWNYPSCKQYVDKESPPQTAQQWLNFRQKYHEAVGGEQASSLDQAWSSYNNDSNSTLHTGFRVPVEVRTSPGKGRGVFTTSHIQKGQQIWDNRYTARFPDECSLKIFFASISEEDACSAIMWGYVNDFYGQGLQFQLDMDEAVYLNEAQTVSESNTHNRFVADDDETGGLEDVQQILEPAKAYALRRVPGRFGMFASQDLEPGTELLIDYAEIHIYGKPFWYEKLCYHSRGFWGWVTLI